MKPLSYLLPALLVLGLGTSLWAQDEGPAKPQPEPPKKPMPAKPAPEMQAFLGVATLPMEPTLRTHLGLDPGVGLIVQHVDPQSAAAGVLEPHDVLVYFEDQQLINHDQLAVLVRNAGPGAKVQLTVLRGGKSQKLQVQLGEREAMPMPDFRGFGQGSWNFHFPMPPQEGWRPQGGERFGHPHNMPQGQQPKGSGPGPMPETKRPQQEEEKPKPKDEKPKAEEASTISVSAGPNAAVSSSSASSVATSSSGEEIQSAVWVDGDLVLHYTDEGGSASLVVVENGEQIFQGPVNSDEELEAVPSQAQAAFGRLLKQLSE